MKAYPVTESEMHELAGLGIGATVCFSAAATCLGFVIDIHKDLALAVDLPDDVRGFWSGVRIAGFATALILAAVGGWLTYRGRTRLGEIKRQTIFDSNQ